jgi:hypothetical protein
VLDRAGSLRLRVGLLLDSLEGPAWQHRMIQKIVQSSCAELSSVLLLHIPRDATVTRGSPGMALRRLLDRAYDYWERRYPCDPDACTPTDLTPLLAGIPVAHAYRGRDESLPHFEPAQIAYLKTMRLDVIVSLVEIDVQDDLRACTNHGVWELDHGDRQRRFGSPPGFWEIFFGVPVTQLSLYTVAGACAARADIARAYSATDLVTTRRNNNARYWSAASLLPRKLEHLAAGIVHPRLASAAGNDALKMPRAAPRAPTSTELARFISRRFWHALASRARELTTLPQWVLMYRLGNGPIEDLRGFQQLLPPKDRFWADPHVLYRNGKHYVFVEELPFATGKGHISVMVLNDQGKWEESTKVLERDYHLSYPCVFEEAGQLYMVPESADNHTVELYRCIEFPYRWEHMGNLLEGLAAFDATPVRHEGLWWLFASVAEERGASSWDQLFAFYSESLTGTWKPHRLNPIVSDVRSARPAGALFERNGSLYRPSQDCSVRYGYGLKLNRITKLRVDDYEEVCETNITPAAGSGILGVHTYASTAGLTVVDALRPRWRF